MPVLINLVTAIPLLPFKKPLVKTLRRPASAALPPVPRQPNKKFRVVPFPLLARPALLADMATIPLFYALQAAKWPNAQSHPPRGIPRALRQQ